MPKTFVVSSSLSSQGYMLWSDSVCLTTQQVASQSSRKFTATQAYGAYTLGHINARTRRPKLWSLFGGIPELGLQLHPPCCVTVLQSMDVRPKGTGCNHNLPTSLTCLRNIVVAACNPLQPLAALID